jgi:hypothetical protein
VKGALIDREEAMTDNLFPALKKSTSNIYNNRNSLKERKFMISIPPIGKRRAREREIININ